MCDIITLTAGRSNENVGEEEIYGDCRAPDSQRIVKKSSFLLIFHVGFFHLMVIIFRELNAFRCR